MHWTSYTNAILWSLIKLGQIIDKEEEIDVERQQLEKLRLSFKNYKEVAEQILSPSADAERQSKKDRLFQERLKSIQSLEKSLDEERKQLEQQHREGVLSKEGRKKAFRFSNFNLCPGGITNFGPFCSFWKIFDRRNILPISFFCSYRTRWKLKSARK